MRDSIEMPTGTVTFLFSDIEGSTRLVQRFGDDYPALLEQHQRPRPVGRRGQGGGASSAPRATPSSWCSPAASEALRAAIDAQLALEAHPWPEDGRIRVRIGLHTGEGTLGRGVLRRRRRPPRRSDRRRGPRRPGARLGHHPHAGRPRAPRRGGVARPRGAPAQGSAASRSRSSRSSIRALEPSSRRCRR